MRPPIVVVWFFITVLISTQAVPQTLIYVVQPDDTLESIAERLMGSRGRWKELWEANSWLKDPKLLKAEDRLRVPIAEDTHPLFDREVFEVVAPPAPLPPAPVFSVPMPDVVSGVATSVITESVDNTTTVMQTPKASWASWSSLVQAQVDRSVVETPLVIGEQYNLRFDLILGAGITTGDSPVDPNAEELLKRLKGKHPTLFAIPVVSGPELQLLTDKPLKFPLLPQRLETITLRQENESDLAYRERIAAATINVSVNASVHGCAALGLSLWTASEDNSKPNMPFDFIVRRVQVGDDGARCDGATLMQSTLAASFVNRAGVAVDASLHIFQLPTGAPQNMPQQYSQALYVDGSEQPLTWRLNADLASYIADPRTYLSRELYQALQLYNYRTLRSRLTSIIFPSDNDSAKRALASIKTLATRSQPATIYAALVGSDGWPQLFPIGLVNGDNEEALGSRINFIEPLQKENLTDARCVSQWTFVVPPQLLSDNGFACPVVNVVAEENSVPGRDLLWEKLMAYLNIEGSTSNAEAAAAASAGSAVPEGLLLLAHQGNGVLSFHSDGEPGVKAGQVHHTYSAGSMGVLVACEGASSGTAVADISWMAKLNELNMDALLVSPFALPVDVGGCFARRWQLALEAAKKSSAPITIAQIYRSVLKDMAADSTEGYDREVLNAVYQFVLAGNTQLPVCRSAQ